jgi:hypothetical protein
MPGYLHFTAPHLVGFEVALGLSRMDWVPTWVDLVPGTVPNCVLFFAVISTFSDLASSSQLSADLKLASTARWLHSWYLLDSTASPRTLVKAASSISDNDSNQISRSSVCSSDSGFTGLFSTDTLHGHPLGVSVSDASETLRRWLFVIIAMGSAVLLLSASRIFMYFGSLLRIYL